jgi:hypothetical protein
VTMDALVETVQALWPRATEPGGAGGPGDGATTFLVIPNSTRPRLLVPALPAAAAAGAMRRYSAALTVREATSRIMVSAALSAGGAFAFRDRLVVDPADSITSHLADVLGQPVVCSLGVGTDRANRKAVLQVFDLRGRSLAFAKVAVSGYAGTLVEAEHHSLQLLARHDLPPDLAVPEVLSLDTWHGHRVLLLSDLAPRAGSTVRPGEVAPPLAEMHAFETSFDLPAVPLRESATWTAVTETLHTLTDPAQHARFAEALAAVDTYAGDRPMPMGGWHGDWTPWNMGRRGPRLLLWDWERFQTGVPVGLDPVHYVVQSRCRTHGLHVSSVIDGLRAAGQPDRMSAPERSPVAAAYLATVTARSLEAAERHRGQAADTFATLMLGALEAWTRS